MTRIFKFLLLILFLSTIFVSYTNTSFAQNTIDSEAVEASLGVAHMHNVQEKDIKDGSLLSSSDKGAILANKPYDAQIIGVVARDAGIIIASENAGEDAVPVISNGQVYVLVSSQEGDIKKGDIITSSTIPGVGAKATKSGYVLGFAMEDYSNSDPTKVGKIVVNLSLHYFNTRSTLAGTLSDILKLTILPTNEGPSALFKYIIAALVVLLSFLFGFLTFGRMAAKGVEALGRNPSASATIHLGIIFNVAIVIMIILVGLVVAFLILRL